ncbi:MAG: hypothetical protein AAF004_12540 [Pseudomonadota bacterium]
MSSEIAPAVPSATIMLLRDSDAGGVDVFMLQRHSGADFASAFVFPGGLAAPDDFEYGLEPFCCGLNDAGASAQLGLPEGGLGLWVAAIRECFEESGYLLARDFSGAICQPGRADHERRFADYRRALAANELTLKAVCESESLTLSCDAIEYVSFWTTPEAMPRRYATRFFVADVPKGQIGIEDGRETVACEWVGVREVLGDDARMRSMKLHPPTKAQLMWLADFDDADAAMRAAREIDKSSITEVLPVVSGSRENPAVRLPNGKEVTF